MLVQALPLSFSLFSLLQSVTVSTLSSVLPSETTPSPAHGLLHTETGTHS